MQNIDWSCFRFILVHLCCVIPHLSQIVSELIGAYICYMDSVLPYLILIEEKEGESIKNRRKRITWVSRIYTLQIKSIL